MNEDNPYASPTIASETSADSPSIDRLVQHGRFLFFLIVLFLLLVEFGLPLFAGTKLAVVRMVLTCGLLIAVWRGHGWAITLLALGFGLGLLMLLPACLMAISAGSLLAFGITSLLGLGYAGILIGLIYSQSLNAFFKYQEQQRQPKRIIESMRSNRRNIVILTSSAAELARHVMKNQLFPSDTAMRIAEGNADTLEVQYDIPSDDNRDWIGESSEIVVLIEKSLATRLEGITIDAEDGQFIFSSHRTHAD